jgi:hypothetical protein
VTLTALADTQVWRERAGNNYGGAATVGVDGGQGGADNHLLALIAFDLTSIPTDAMVQGGLPELLIYTTGNALDVGSVTVYRVLESWIEGAGDDTSGVANWDDRAVGQAWTAAGVGPGSRAGTAMGQFTPSSADTEYVVALTGAVVQGWITTPGSNFGIVLDVGDEAGSGVGFHSKESAMPALAPRLRFTWCAIDCP